jgi:hypothetical protein
MHLGLEILAAAVSLRRPEYALRICTSIVTLIHEDTGKIIKLAHFSGKEYLVLKKPTVEDDKGGPRYRISNDLAHATVAKETVKYLLQGNNEDVSKQMTIDKPLLPYSAQFWYQHAGAVGDDIAFFLQLREQIHMIFSSEYSKSCLNWLKTYGYDSGVSFGYLAEKNYLQALYYASPLGFQESVEKLLKEDADTAAKGGNF